MAAAATGYCVRCKKKEPMTGAVRTKTRKGQPMLKGKCAKCGTRMCRFTKKG